MLVLLAFPLPATRWARSGLPWYAYGGGIAAVVIIGKVVSEVASKAIAEVEAEFDAKEAAKLAAMQGESSGWSDEPEGDEEEILLPPKQR